MTQEKGDSISLVNWIMLYVYVLASFSFAPPPPALIVMLGISSLRPIIEQYIYIMLHFKLTVILNLVNAWWEEEKKKEIIYLKVCLFANFIICSDL